MKGTIIKCKDCGFKYYDGDIHKCVQVRVVSAEEKPGAEEKNVNEEKTRARKVVVKTQKNSFKIWKDS